MRRIRKVKIAALISLLFISGNVLFAQNDSIKRFNKQEYEKIVNRIDYSGEPTKKSDTDFSFDFFPDMPAWLPEVLIYGFILLLIVLLIASLKNKGRWFKLKNEIEDDNNLKKAEPAPEENENLENLLNDALARKDFRQAIRFQYLILLFLLNRRGLIVSMSHKTNGHYSKELLAHTELRLHFDRITRQFENYRYGNSIATANSFESVRENFLALKETLENYSR